MNPATEILVSDAPFDPDEALSAFRARHKGAGAIVSFIGDVRGEGGDVESLTLDHYPGFTEVEIEKIARAARQRWPLLGISIVHRVGEMAPGEPIVFVAAAAAHRRAAFDSVAFLMDYLKSQAPFWKKETRNGATKWIEPRTEDFADKARWDRDGE